MRTLIIGIGNPLRGDDGLGWDVAGELSSELRRDDVQVLATHQLTPELSDLVSRAELVLFIDATRSEDPGNDEMPAGFASRAARAPFSCSIPCDLAQHGGETLWLPACGLSSDDCCRLF